MLTEKLNSPEMAIHPKQNESSGSDLELTPELANSMFEQRLKQTDELQPFISLKFYYFIKEKIAREQSTARKLLKQEENKQEILDKYSFVLNPSYFEQKIIS